MDDSDVGRDESGVDLLGSVLSVEAASDDAGFSEGSVNGVEEGGACVSMVVFFASLDSVVHFEVSVFDASDCCV